METDHGLLLNFKPSITRTNPTNVYITIRHFVNATAKTFLTIFKFLNVTWLDKLRFDYFKPPEELRNKHHDIVLRDEFKDVSIPKRTMCKIKNLMRCIMSTTP